MMTKKLLLMGSMAVTGIAFMSCSKENLYDQEAVDNRQDAMYASNFEKRYGKIDPNQTWDFSTDTPTFTSVSSNGMTRAASAPEFANFDREEGTMTIEKEISEWMFENLPKGKNNSKKGRQFDMAIYSDLIIVPIFQGCASYYWELWIHVDGVGDERIWSKGEGLKFRKAGTNDDFQSVGIDKNGMQRGEGAYEVQAPCYTYKNLLGAASASFYLKVWKDGYTQYEAYQQNPLDESNLPEIKSSVNSWMLDLQGVPVPSGLPEGRTATIIGCEDGNDKDYEDLVFMVYGDPTKRVNEMIEQKTKRYIMEDLGDTDDFDFNDVVFDISYDRKKITYTYASETATVPSSQTVESLPNVGVVRAAGGVYNFDIMIDGQSVWKKSNATTIKTTDMVNTKAGYNPNYVIATFEAPGYNATTNNISVTVETRGSSERVYVIPFPEKGKAPKIVAVPADTKWMTERTRVPEEWFRSTSN